MSKREEGFRKNFEAIYKGNAVGKSTDFGAGAFIRARLREVAQAHFAVPLEERVYLDGNLNRDVFKTGFLLDIARRRFQRISAAWLTRKHP